ncbi:MAG: hypothetical protein WCH46_02555 [bacterium]
MSGLHDFGVNAFTMASVDQNGNTNTETGTTSHTYIVYGAGGKYYIADEMAIRALLGFSTTTDGDAKTSSGKTTITTLGVAAGLELHTHPVYSTSPYFGGQISFARVSGSSDFTSGTTSSTTSGSRSVIGIAAFAGFDYFVSNAIAVGGEFRFGFSTASGSDTDTAGKSTDAPSSTGIGISGGGIHLVIHM